MGSLTHRAFGLVGGGVRQIAGLEVETGKREMAKTLSEIAAALGYGETVWPSGEIVEIEPNAYAISERRGALYLIDIKYTLFNAKQIGRKSPVSEAGFRFQLSQLARWKRQIGEIEPIIGQAV